MKVPKNFFLTPPLHTHPTRPQSQKRHHQIFLLYFNTEIRNQHTTRSHLATCTDQTTDRHCDMAGTHTLPYITVWRLLNRRAFLHVVHLSVLSPRRRTFILALYSVTVDAPTAFLPQKTGIPKTFDMHTFHDMHTPGMPHTFTPSTPHPKPVHEINCH